MTTTLEEKTDAEPETEVAQTPRRSLRERFLGLSRRDRNLMGAGVGVAVGMWVVASVLTGGDATTSQEPAVESATTRQPLQKPPAQLTPAEYLELGRGAVKEGRLTEARRHLERALASRPTDHRLRAELCRVMADVCHRMDQPDAAALYREEAASLMSGLDGTALVVFQLAEADLAAGNVRAARRRYHAIALGGGQAFGSDTRVREEAERRLAKAYEAEFKATREAPLDQMSDPVVFKERGIR